MNDKLTPYGEFAALLDNLPLIVREARRARGLVYREVAEQAAVAPSTIYRCEKGHLPNGRSLAAILRWLDGPP